MHHCPLVAFAVKAKHPLHWQLFYNFFQIGVYLRRKENIYLYCVVNEHDEVQTVCKLDYCWFFLLLSYLYLVLFYAPREPI